jgi:hypothetical protein
MMNPTTIKTMLRFGSSIAEKGGSATEAGAAGRIFRIY